MNEYIIYLSNLKFQVFGYPIAIIFQTIATFLFGIILSFSLSVRLSLVCLAAAPFALLSVIVESRYVIIIFLPKKRKKTLIFLGIHPTQSS